MAKKSRRARVNAKPAAAPQADAAAQPQAQSTAATRRAARQQPQVAAVNVMQAGHYEYVTQDLVRIGIISAVLILILVVLTFIPALNS